jgi:hypothetical protein
MPTSETAASLGLTGEQVKALMAVSRGVGVLRGKWEMSDGRVVL